MLIPEIKELLKNIGMGVANLAISHKGINRINRCFE